MKVATNVMAEMMKKIWASTANLEGEERKYAYAKKLASSLRCSVSTSQRIHQPILH